MSTYLDTGLLKGVDGVRHTVLELVLDGGRSEEEQVLLNQLGHVIECISSAGDLRSSSVVQLEPLAVLLLRDLAHSETERPQSFRGVVLIDARWGRGLSA